MDPEQNQQLNPTPVSSGNPYFMGDSALIKFSGGEDGNGPQTTWLVNKGDKTIRPFESDIALQKAFGEGSQSALQNVITVVPPSIDQDGGITDGVLNGFNILSSDYTVKEDGSSKKLDFSPHQLKQRYGKPVDQNTEGLSVEVLDGLLNRLKSKEQETGIPSNFINKIKQDENLMAFYISALSYGEYTLSDVYKDIVQRSKRGE